MAGFTKLFSQILDSTIWDEPWTVKGVWITLLAMADRNGCVYASIPGLARRATVTLEDCETALQVFLSPDPYSRTPDHDGRRIEPIDGGWQLLNYLKYREQRDEDARREQNRVAQQRHRASSKNADSQHKSAPSAHAEADAEALQTTPLPPASRGMAAPRPNARKSKKPRGYDFDIASLAMSEEAEGQLRRVWEAWPRIGWNYSTKSESPRRLNFAGTAARFVDVLKFCPVRKADGTHITAEDLAEAAIAWVTKRKHEAGVGVPPCVPCIENFFSSVEGKKHHWKEAVLEHFGAGGDA